MSKRSLTSLASALDVPTRRDEILRAARKLFVEHGIPGSSMRLLAREVGVTEGALYRHFPSKEEIVATLFENEARSFHDRLVEGVEAFADGREPASSKTDPWAQLDALVRAFIDYGRNESESFRVIMVLHQAPGVARRGPVKLPRHQFEKAIDRVARESGRMVPDRTGIVVMIAGLLSRLVEAERDGHVALGREELAALAVRAVRGLLEATLSPAVARPRR